jgi:hypothetical protein
MGDETELFMRGGSEERDQLSLHLSPRRGSELVRDAKSAIQNMRKEATKTSSFFESCFGADGRVQR